MIEHTHKLSITRQASLLSISRGSVYHKPNPINPETQVLMNRMGQLHLKYPLAGSRVLSWKLSTTMDVHSCLEAVEEALAAHGTTKIMNTDQGSPFTSVAFTNLLTENHIRISMDGKGCWGDNVFVERLWRSVKYEEVYLHAYDSVYAIANDRTPALTGKHSMRFTLIVVCVKLLINAYSYFCLVYR